MTILDHPSQPARIIKYPATEFTEARAEWQLEHFNPTPEVDLEATWALTIAGARVLGADVDPFAPATAVALFADRWIAVTR